MGLGKQFKLGCWSRKEKEMREPSLIMPTSPIYNWEMEAAKFNPILKSSPHRNKPTKTLSGLAISKFSLLWHHPV
jgi:SNF2 family DNA or RNA helicase